MNAKPYPGGRNPAAFEILIALPCWDLVPIRPTPVVIDICVDFENQIYEPRRMEIGPFSIGRHPVTAEQYEAFCRATSYVADPRSLLKGGRPPSQLRHPATNISYHDADAFCHWAGARLPTIAEWLYCFGCDGRRYPWGDTFDATRANARESEIGSATPVGLYSPQGDSLLGIADMCGNVWEWTSTIAQRRPGDETKDLMMACGPGFDHPSWQREIPLERSYRNHSTGFRVVTNID